MRHTFAKVTFNPVDQRGLRTGYDKANSNLDGKPDQTVEIPNANINIVDVFQPTGGSSVSCEWLAQTF